MANPSGKTQIRILPALHAHLIRIAEEEGKSLNSLIATLLAGGSNFKLPDSRDAFMPVVHQWGSDSHVDQIMERLGRFESWHIEHELQMSGPAVNGRINKALKAGVIEIERPGRGSIATIYRWVGPPRE